MKRIGKVLLSLCMIICLGGCKKEEKQEITEEQKIIQTAKEEYDKYINHYYYDTYSDDQKEIYDKLYNAFISYDTSIQINSDLSEEELEMIYDQVLYDHPEIFYITYRFNLEKMDTVCKISFDYFYSEDLINTYSQKLAIIQRDYIKAVEGMNVVEIVDYTYQYLFPRIEYDHDTFDQPDFNQYDYYGSYNIINGLVNGTCVCAGYATAFQYLLNSAGYQCLLVQGSSSGGNHAWDCLELNDQFYYFDPTWDDNKYGIPVSYYAYYGMSYEQADERRDFKNCAFEQATSTAFNYNVIHGNVVEDLKEIPDIIQKQLGNELIMIQCKNQTDYNYALSEYVYKDYLRNYYASYQAYQRDDVYTIYFVPQNDV